MNSPSNITSDAISLYPIGVIRSHFQEQNGTPVQPNFATNESGVIEIFPEFVSGLADLDGFSHIIIIFYLHRQRDVALRVTPYLDDHEHGIFATRSPKRPNHLGLSVVRLDRIVENRVFITGVDMLDGSPVLDIKPFVPAFDAPKATRIGWLKDALSRNPVGLADKRFSDLDSIDIKNNQRND